MMIPSNGNGTAQQKADIFAGAVNQIALSLKRPLIFGPDNKPLSPSAAHTFSRDAAKRQGSLKNWIPKRIFGQTEALDRQRIVERSIDLTQNDPHAAGVVDTFATTVIGAGLTPHPTLDRDILGIDKNEVRRISAQQRAIYQRWTPFADAGERMSFGGIQFLVERSVIQCGEYLVLLPMLSDPVRPYSLACQVIHPLRLKTPTDLLSHPNLRDGIEIGQNGQPVAYWIKKADPSNRYKYFSDISGNFLRIPARQGHRWKVLHGFIPKNAEDVRGMPAFAPAIKYFRDLNDFLDAELVSNIVTAAFSLFIETGAGMDPMLNADLFTDFSESRTTRDGTERTDRYQEMIPGMVWYGNSGEKPHPIAANRPGATFEPFTKIIKHAISMSLNIPYTVLFKDVSATNFAGFRSAMLEAWRVFSFRRVWHGQHFCQRVYSMLMEEAYLRGDLSAENFYADMQILTRADWRGGPKGDIEPIKAANADILLNNSHLKTKAESIAERGGDLRTTFDQLEEEDELLIEKNLVKKELE